MPRVSFDDRALTIDGRRSLVLSGSVHYPRSTPGMWPRLIERSKEAGLNTIETYVFWNLHERKRGQLDFTDRLDLRRFCELVQAAGMNLILRIGPYICAETNYGGFPAWLRDVPGMRMRTWNQPFMAEMERWVRELCGRLQGMFAPQGGPIVAAQIENEYSLVAKNNGEEGQKYLQWAIDLGRSLNLDVPWVMCVGAAKGAIETINGWYGHPQIEAHRKNHPEQPALWTENWPGWYGTWGYAQRRRTPEDVAYGVARFFAAGETGVNYYMWHAGTNFGRESMYLQTTGYGYDAPLDEFGLETTKSRHLGALHEVLGEYADILLHGERAAPLQVGKGQWACVYVRNDETLAFLCNDDREKAAKVRACRGRFDLAPGSVLVLHEGAPVFNTAEVAEERKIVRSFAPAEVELRSWAWQAEPLPGRRSDRSAAIESAQPREQLGLTKDQSDYCWYVTKLVAVGGPGTLTLEGAADYVRVFVDGKLMGSTPTPLKEERGTFDGPAWKQSFALDLGAGEHELAILACALGLIKGDWMLGQQNMACERKGLFAPVKWNGVEVTGWTMLPGLMGERLESSGTEDWPLPWNAEVAEAVGQPLRWWRAEFLRPAGDGAGENRSAQRTLREGEGPGGLAALALDLAGMGKGMIYVNGRCAGRYWLVTADDPGVADWQKPALYSEGVGEPTQRYYHLPAEWLGERNTVVLFEEAGGDPRKVKVCRWG